MIDDTIEKNIAFGISKNSIDRKRLINSAKNAQLHNFIMSLPKNINQKLQKEVEIFPKVKNKESLLHELYTSILKY